METIWNSDYRLRFKGVAQTIQDQKVIQLSAKKIPKSRKRMETIRTSDYRLRFKGDAQTIQAKKVKVLVNDVFEVTKRKLLTKVIDLANIRPKHTNLRSKFNYGDTAFFTELRKRTPPFFRKKIEDESPITCSLFPHDTSQPSTGAKYKSIDYEPSPISKTPIQ
ncbi:hypothetical protein LXL04_006332 [Taraxacum kok-saghyz]